MTHELKSWPEVFESRLEGFKPWEFRNNDRKFYVGDFIHEREWNPKTERYTGRSILSRITCLYDGRGAYARSFGIPKDRCIMTLDTILPGDTKA